VVIVPSFTLNETAAVFDNLPAPVADAAPRSMEVYDQGHGCIVYRSTVPPGPATALQVDHVNDFAWVLLDDEPVGVMDRRSRRFQVKLPAHEKPAQLDILVEAMGHVNFGREIHDRKGLQGAPRLVSAGSTNVLSGPWRVYPLRLDAPMLAGLKWKSGVAKGPAFWRGSFNVKKAADTFLDLRNWGQGVVWINGHCLARYWNIGPTQTAYVPGPWLRDGTNEIIILDLVGPTQPVLAGLDKPILDMQRNELDFARGPTPQGHLALGKPAYTGTFATGSEPQEVKFPEPIEGKQFCIESLNAQDGKPYAAIAELDLLDPAGKSIPHTAWTIAYVDSEELVGEDGSAGNAIDGQVTTHWHTAWKTEKPGHPHQLVIDLGETVPIGGFRYTPRAGENQAGHIKDYRVYVGPALVTEAKQ